MTFRTPIQNNTVSRAYPRRATAARVIGLTLFVGSLFGGGLVAQQLEQGQVRAKNLVISYNGQPIKDWITIQGVPDSLTLTIVPQDSLGNNVPVTAFEIQVWDPMVLGVLGTEVQASQVVVRLQPRRRGQTTIQIRMSGTRQWVLVGLRETVLAISPGQVEQPGAAYAPGWKVWTVGGRADIGFYSYSFNNDTVFTGRVGVLGEVFVGREWSSGLTLVAGVTGGLVKADSFQTSVTVTVVQIYARADYAFMRPNKVRPVVSLGGGMYRARTGGGAAGIWNASFYWMVGAGVDVTLTPKITGEARLMLNDLLEVTSPYVNGHVGRLIMLGVGARMQL